MLLPIIVASGISIIFVNHAFKEPEEKSSDQYVPETSSKYVDSAQSESEEE